MAANVRLRNVAPKVQGSAPPPAAAQVLLRTASGSVTSGAPPVVQVARVLLRGVTGLVTQGTPVTPTVVNVRLRAVSGFVGPLGTGPGSKPKGSAYTSRGGATVAVGLFKSGTP